MSDKRDVLIWKDDKYDDASSKLLISRNQLTKGTLPSQFMVDLPVQLVPSWKANHMV